MKVQNEKEGKGKGKNGYKTRVKRLFLNLNIFAGASAPPPCTPPALGKHWISMCWGRGSKCSIYATVEMMIILYSGPESTEKTEPRRRRSALRSRSHQTPTVRLRADCWTRTRRSPPSFSRINVSMSGKMTGNNGQSILFSKPAVGFDRARWNLTGPE